MLVHRAAVPHHRAVFAILAGMAIAVFWKQPRAARADRHRVHRQRCCRPPSCCWASG
ncbi:MAG: hypothetical protein ACLTMP_07475 [Eggerthella lenta]